MSNRRDDVRSTLEFLRDTSSWQWPEDTGEMLLRILRDREANVEDRTLAAELAGDFVVINDALADALLSILSDGEAPSSLRAQAAISFGPALEQADIDGFEDPDDVPISEPMFYRVQEMLRQLYTDADTPREVRRRILEAAVRAEEDWHEDAIRDAYASGDDDWKLTAVFCMQHVSGFDKQILESLESGNPEIHYEAIRAAGNSELKKAWPHIAAILASDSADKDLLIAAIEAAVNINPLKAPEALGELLDSEDEDIADTAQEALDMAEGIAEIDDDDDDDDEEDW